MPLHPKAREFAKSGLFAGVKSFEELEKRIAAITENKGKGDAFEVFAEAYLVTQRRHEIGHVWPLDAAPMDLLKKLKLPLKDYGVDGVTRTALGGHQVYQVKFRSGRTPLTWEELSTFMGLSDSPEIQSKVVITNCDELPAVINERHNFYCIRGSDLDRLTAEDFRAIEDWVSEAAITLSKSTPFPHQQEAMDAIVPALKSEDRVSAIMACGTGKTLTALWTTEQLGASKVLVLLPSLALLRQTLHEWLKETNLDLAYLCVCSDPTVKGDADEISTAQSDLDFEVSTDASTVRRFLDAPFKGTKVIFSTYQSAAVVGEAMKKGETFDLGIFDEAHKTAGREGRNYGYALEDKNIAIRKRLFVTATPRRYNPSKRTKEGEATIAFSMDEPKVYGPQSYVLSFGEAARRKIICGYKVIISVITSDQVTDELLSKGIVAVKGDEIRARQVANQIALRDAVAQYGVSKIFTFHSTVKSAASFVAEGNEGVRTHLQEFTSLHVSGAMPTARRERVMKVFRSAPRAVMSNARCLTEGVDVPAVDMVAFLSPKKSKVDIVQAIGRAMRKSGSKEVGYVLIPLYLEQKSGESLEEAVARANFEEVWDILQSLQEQDEVLAELIRDMAVAKGHGKIRGKGFDDNRFSDRISFTGPVLALESIRQAVTTKVLERLESSWDLMFGKLVKFKEEYGHTIVPQKFEKDPTLGKWVSSQRGLFKKGLLPYSRSQLLNSLSFNWEYGGDKTSWSDNYTLLTSFKKQNGDCNVPYNYPAIPSLGIWVSTQRSKRKTGKLSSEQIALLNSIGFKWAPEESSWDSNFIKLKEFLKLNGHCDVPARFSEDTKLAKWVHHQRDKKSNGKLLPERERLLNSIGFSWRVGVSLRTFDQQIEDLIRYKTLHGNCNVPNEYPDSPSLGSWVGWQRHLKSKGKLSTERIKILEEIGFIWSPFDILWDDFYQRLVKFKKSHGHVDVPQKYPKDPKLRSWVNTQRQYARKGKLSSDRLKLLDAVGFTWDPLVANWEENFANLESFKSTHGHCRVPVTLKTDPKLGKWVSHQRNFYVKGKLSADRIRRLEALGFEWKAH
jgi:superfamily II DNA or RNA helicase